LLCVLVVAALCGCREREETLARVGGEQVQITAFQTHLEAVTGTSWKTVEVRVASRLLDQFLDQEVVVAAAHEQNLNQIPNDPARRSLAVRMVVDELCGPVPQVAPETLDEEIRHHLEKKQPAQAHVRQLLLRTREEALAARQRLEAGEDFVAVSTEVSQAPNADGGGELGMVAQGTLPEEMDAVIFAMTVGEISEPVAGTAGFHLFEVLEIIPEGTPARSQVEAQVRRQLHEEVSRSFIQECISRLAEEVGVKIYPNHLWFPYTGKYYQ
jgi:parvulin-like peptidyl-prolyl isomerase